MRALISLHFERSKTKRVERKVPMPAVLAKEGEGIGTNLTTAKNVVFATVLVHSCLYA
jgi:hypothetical protein